MNSKKNKTQLNSWLVKAQRASIALTAILTAMTSQARHSNKASVDLESASYSRTWTDTASFNKNDAFKIRRNYDSRRVFIGLFGFGWCSNLEVHLKVLSKERVILKQCGSNLGHSFIHSSLGVYISPILDNQKVMRLQNGQYKLFIGTDAHQIFNSNGQLQRWQVSKSETLVFNYDHLSRIKLLKWNDRYEVNLSYSGPQNRQLATIKVKNGETLTYKYVEFNLIKVRKNQVEGLEYQYDLFNNLTEFKIGKDIQERVEYNPLSDRVMLLQEADGCKKAFFYKTMPLQEKIISSVVKTCANKIVLSARKEFLYKKVGNGYALYQSLLHHKDNIFKTNYNLKTGLIELVHSSKYNINIVRIESGDSNLVFKLSSPSLGVHQIYQGKLDHELYMQSPLEKRQQDLLTKLAANLMTLAQSDQVGEVL